MTAIRASVDRRIRVIIVRRQLEEHAATLVEQATGTRPQRHRHIARRLMLLTAGVSEGDWAAAHSLARQSGLVYRETSSVLHSHRAFGDVPEQLVREWEQVVVTVGDAVGSLTG